MKYFFLSALLLTITMTAGAQNQLKTPALSPGARISQDFSVSNIEISYSRPSMRGRKIFGDVVPYGRVWRTGANAATKLKIGEELEIGGMKIKAGEYALYTIPGKDKWEIILNNGTGNWGANGYSKENDVARFFVRPSIMEHVMQTFTVGITDITFTTCKIEIAWERTKIVIPVVANNNDAIEVNIEKSLSVKPSLPYFQAANYYYETERKTELAKTYVDKALEQDPKAFYMWYLKARIEKRLGNYEDAIASAKKSIELAKGTANEYEYQHNNEKLIEDIQKRHPKQEVD